MQCVHDIKITRKQLLMASRNHTNFAAESCIKVEILAWYTMVVDKIMSISAIESCAVCAQHQNNKKTTLKASRNCPNLLQSCSKQTLKFY